MRILITGTGMLGSALQQQAQAEGHVAQAVSHRDLDVADRLAVLQRVARAQPNLILHTASLTRVNYCEEHPAEAFAVNGDGTAHVVAAAQKLGCTVVYYSTDYVFDGRQDVPWLEDDSPRPLNVYGASKLAGEQAVLAYPGGHVIRTSGVFGPRADGIAERNFFRQICSTLRRQQPVNVVADQITSVTYAPALAAMTFELLANNLPPLVHLVCAGAESWYAWTRIAAETLRVDPALIRAIPAVEYPSVARRPAFSAMASCHQSARQLIAANPAAPLIRNYCTRLAVDNM